MEKVDAQLHLAGTFDDPSLLAELECTHAWQKVKFHGQVGRTEIQDILSKCTIGLVTLHPTPSYKEAYPIKMFEYLAAGCAVVASDFPLYKSLLFGSKCAHFVDPQDTSEIAHVLQELTADPQQTLAMAKAARSCFEEKYSWENEVKTLHEFYLSL